MLIQFYYKSCTIQKDEVYLNLILEYVPETVYRVARHYAKQRQIIPILYIKVSVFPKCKERVHPFIFLKIFDNTMHIMFSCDISSILHFENFFFLI